jgi:hypothetical protein
VLCAQRRSAPVEKHQFEEELKSSKDPTEGITKEEAYSLVDAIWEDVNDRNRREETATDAVLRNLVKLSVQQFPPKLHY